MTQLQGNFLLPQVGIDSHRLLETLFESVRDGVAITDAAGRIVCCNASLAVLAQRPIEEVVGRTPEELWKGRTVLTETTEETTAREEMIERADGSRRTVAVRSYQLGSNPVTNAVLYRDITHLKVLERRGRQSDDQYKFLLEHVNDGILITQNNTIVYANTHMAQMLGYEPDELSLVGRTQVGPHSTAKPYAGHNRYEATFTHRDGSELPVEIVASAGYYSGDSAVFEVVRDISARRQAERRSSVLLSLGQKLNLANTVKDVARVTLQAAQDLIGWHSSTLELMEHSESQVLYPVIFHDTVNGEIAEVDPPAESCRLDSLAARALRQGPIRIIRSPDDPADGFVPFGDTNRRSMSLMFVPIHGGDNTVGVMSVQSYDMNAYSPEDLEALQALAEHCSGALQRTIALVNLRSSEQRYRQMFEKNQTIKLLLDPDTGRVVDANPSACRFYGYSLEAIKSLKLSELTVSRSEDLAGYLSAAIAEKESIFCVEQRATSGARRCVEICTSPLEVNGRLLLHAIIHDVTQREQALAQIEALAELGRRLNSALSSIEAGRILVDVADKLIGWDACFVDLFASDVEHTMKPGHLLMPVVHIDEVRGHRQEVAPLYSVLPATSISYRVLQEGAYMILRTPEEMRLRPGQMFGDSGRPSASLLYVPIRGTAGVLGVLSIQSYEFAAYTGADLQMLQSLADNCGGALERTRAEEQVRLLESAVRLSSDMVIITSADPGSPTGTRIVFVNDAVCQLTGYAREEMIGQSLSLLQGPATDREVLGTMRDSLQAGNAITVELVNYRKDGTSYIVEFSAYSIADSYGRPRFFVSVQRDITARKRTEQDLVHRAFHDPLTGLANRALLFERLEHILARSSRSTERFAILFLDLDGFKEVNDQWGHDVGDQLLSSVARRLETCVRPGDTVSRLGGDEFVILLEGVESANDAKCVGDRVLESFTTPHAIGDRQLMCAASIGIAHQPQIYTSAADVLRLADNALYRAKAKGKSRYEIFEEPVTPFI